MELNYLKEFVTLADIGNYLEAADQLYISQSALSRHIKAMEDELGISLFDRSTRKISLTKFGRLFYPYALNITNLRNEYQTALFNYKRNISGTLSIGSIPAIAQYGIIDLLLHFQQNCPNFSLNLIEDDSLRLIDKVQKNDLELAFIRTNIRNHPDFVQIPFAEDPLAAVVPASHPLAARESLRLSELSDEKLLLLSSDTFMYQLCVSECCKSGFEAKVGYTGNRSENLLAMVEKEAGIALLTKNPILPLKNENVSIVKIEPKITTWICLIYRKDKKLSLPAEKFIAMMPSASS